MAESSVITCPECTKRVKGKGDLEGKKIKCPFCSKVFVVAPGSTKSAAAAAKGPQKAPPPPATPIAMAPVSSDDDENDPNPYGLTHLDIAPRCPNCANKMADEEAF